MIRGVFGVRDRVRGARFGRGTRACPLVLAVAVCACALSACGSAAPGGPLAVGDPSALPAPRGSHVVEIVLENAEYGEVIGSRAAPYVGALARRYGLATRSFAIAHPSLPNYLALTSGSTHGIESDCTDCAVAGRNLVDQLEAARVSWAAYLEELPAPCYAGAGRGGYAKKHNPFIYYRDVAGSHARCSHLAGFGALAGALRTARLPAFVWITPNLCDDGHDCGVGAADRFLARTVPALLHELGPRGFLIVTWDEGSSDAGCCGLAHGGHVATVVAGPLVRPGARDRVAVDHYGVLRTVEEALGLGPLGAAGDPRSGSLAPLFEGGVVPRVGP
jgi:phosphatidylinositol-3-phosphatase